MDFRIGFGYDVHQLQQGLPFWLGGVQIEHTKGSLGHSDGDALIHAICDAMLGAANLGDIGVHFPDTDPSLKGIDSKILLRKTMDIIAQIGYTIGNIDSTICLQRPKVKDYIPKMQAELAKALDVEPQQISIKATTTEKLGFVGREEGVTAYAVVLLRKN
ncbi:MAG: 2-C-methyl-D-erythritol 2,4-cyclodiphosphate synthase [Tenuifilum sp.]|jgi:2-C-methyl-D-erythritol 2,4-cyclodiphosphate synthase|uniref:2-C-methyl-D-erythritol 2,4-cyclodiphosphate synthase n=1 Tax=Tenuifilum TaxID=2760873 RepID=UPI001B75467D|nr:2-C-methyl-D-erythritol 2,4-cyclodiphosphate synthase [Bacteroidales bacterium]HOK61196.1 2-C-methyl-D-erythritol 2,4-cyclodiphosphate synthase [Tenuifilum sp.]HOK86526.1 2-C-methyl-D-erythritol 2,4-cyclodiphosphate synthase [Tenuifilum sp.]HON70312.1 2-C-methyl-D-erythritol 2,4-cyclodiphosphate synthase [Tenuifilum sp.]HPP90805.1 2-C-methyl-D-erythritol 2,4-cyclodiphosphate synthase [Tenuifilum sp.]